MQKIILASTSKWRKEILEMLLRAQATIQKTRPEVQLITFEELVTIQTLWQRDFLYEYDVGEIYRRVIGKPDTLHMTGPTREQTLLREVCADNSSDYHVLGNLLRAQRSRMLLVNPRGLQKDMERVLDEHLCPTVTDVYSQHRDQ